MGSSGYRGGLLLCVVFGLLAALPSTTATGSSSGEGTGNTCGVSICFAIDASGSIKSGNFAKVQTFVTNVIKAVDDLATGKDTPGNMHMHMAMLLHISYSPASLATVTSNVLSNGWLLLLSS